MAYAFFTCIDSNTDVASLLEQSKHLKSLRGKFQRVGLGILLTTRQLLTAVKNNRLFFGFDEVWFFPNADVSPKPESFVIVGPELVDSRETDQYSEWLHASNCSLGLGDGTGMNFCLRVRGVARFIVEAFNEAGAPSVKK